MITISQPPQSSSSSVYSLFTNSSSSSPSSSMAAKFNQSSRYLKYFGQLFYLSNENFTRTLLSIPDIVSNGMKILSTLTIISLVFIMYFL